MKRSAIANAALIGVAFVFLTIWTFPVLWALLTSFKTERDVLAYPPTLFFTPTLSNYEDILFGATTILPNLISSFIVSTLTTIDDHAARGSRGLCAGPAQPARQAGRRFLYPGDADAAAGRIDHPLLPVFAEDRLARQLQGNDPDLSDVLAAVRDLADGVLFRGYPARDGRGRTDRPRRAGCAASFFTWCCRKSAAASR